MKLEFFETYDRLFDERLVKLKLIWQIKLKTMKICKEQLKEFKFSRSLSKIDSLAQKKNFNVETFDLENIDEKMIIDKEYKLDESI
jgi:hypothetical protein